MSLCAAILTLDHEAPATPGGTIIATFEARRSYIIGALRTGGTIAVNTTTEPVVFKVSRITTLALNREPDAHGFRPVASRLVLYGSHRGVRIPVAVKKEPAE